MVRLITVNGPKERPQRTTSSSQQTEQSWIRLGLQRLSCSRIQLSCGHSRSVELTRASDRVGYLGRRTKVRQH